MTLHIAFVTVTGAGHVNPALALAEELSHRGYRVSYAVTEEYKSRVESGGVEPVLYKSMLPTESPPETDPQSRMIRTLTLFIDETIAMVEQLERMYSTDKPDVIAYDGPIMAGRILALGWNVPAVRLFPLFAHEGYSANNDKVLTTVEQLIPAMTERLTEFLAKRDLSSVTVDQLMNHVEQCCISFLPRAFQVDGGSFDERFTFVGPCLSDGRLFEGDWEDPVDDQPVLLISLGTVFNADAGFFSTCMQAFADLPWHVVIASGERINRAELGLIPDNFEVHAHVPQLAVLARARVFLCHAGMGSVMESLYHGTPVVAVPQSPEHEVTARRIQELGLGRVVMRHEVSAASLRAAVLEIAHDERIRVQAEEMKRHVRMAGGRAGAADSVESFLRATLRGNG